MHKATAEILRPPKNGGLRMTGVWRFFLRQKAAGSERQAFHDESVRVKFFGQAPACARVTTMIFICLGGPKRHAHSGRQLTASAF
jgi:hypothetical protein